MRRFIPLLLVIACIVAYEASGRLRQSDSGDVPAVMTGSLEEMPADDASAPLGPARAAANLPARNGKISRGTPFFVEMQRAGLSPQDIHNVVQASKEFFNFRRVQAGQTYTIYGDPSDGLDSLDFAIDKDQILRVGASDGAFHTRIDTIPYEVEHFVTSGTINSSIFNALVAKDADPELASYLTIVFQWDVDFFKDIRKGDTFTILYEKKSYPDGKSQLGNVLAARVMTQGREHFAFAFRNKKGILNYFDENGKSLQKTLLRAPLKYNRISSGFSYHRKHPIHGNYRPHLGVDYAAPRGTPVHATGDGKVTAATYRGGNGKYIKIRHNSRYETYYLHLSGYAKGVKVGRYVRQGQLIGYVGSTGSATAPHLDYRIKVDGRFVNPRTVRLPSKEPVPADEMALYETVRDSFLVEFLATSPEGPTVLVEKPAVPLRHRMAVLH